jgi:copper chaperone NosL
METKTRYWQCLLQYPLSLRARVLLVLAVLSIPLIFYAPLWTMSFRSNQYPDPLRMAIYIDHLEGQKTPMRDDLREINSLNHYIGMRPLLESDFAEFLWLPFAVGFFALIVLRSVVFGTVRDLVDIVVLFSYFGLFSAWTFYSRLYQYGHNLSPEAAIKVEGFTPPFFGSVKIANFWVNSYPGGGSYLMALFGLLLVVALVVAYLNARGHCREATAD